MPAKSKQQQSKLRGASRQMVESMSEDELERMASVKRKKLPRRAPRVAAEMKHRRRKSGAKKQR